MKKTIGPVIFCPPLRSCQSLFGDDRLHTVKAAPLLLLVSIASGGFTFTPTSISFGSIFIGGTGSPPNHRVTNGTNNLFALNHTEVNMAETGGLNFSLNSLSVVGSFIVSPNRWADEVDIVGNIAAGGYHYPYCDPFESTGCLSKYRPCWVPQV